MTTLNSSRHPADICRENGWTVGTQLVGDESHGPTVIEITAIGEALMLAKMVTHCGFTAAYRGETIWTLDCRDWRVVG